MHNVSKSDIVEMKSFKAAPTAVNTTAEATCILFSTKPSYDNFKKLINQRDIISAFSSYDRDNISDYALRQLKKYIEEPNFNPEYVRKISSVCSVFCQVIRALYNYGIVKNQVRIKKLEFLAIIKKLFLHSD